MRTYSNNAITSILPQGIIAGRKVARSKLSGWLCCGKPMRRLWYPVDPLVHSAAVAALPLDHHCAFLITSAKLEKVKGTHCKYWHESYSGVCRPPALISQSDIAQQSEIGYYYLLNSSLVSCSIFIAIASPFDQQSPCVRTCSTAYLSWPETSFGIAGENLLPSDLHSFYRLIWSTLRIINPGFPFSLIRNLGGSLSTTSKGPTQKSRSSLEMAFLAQVLFKCSLQQQQLTFIVYI